MDIVRRCARWPRCQRVLGGRPSSCWLVQYLTVPRFVYDDVRLAWYMDLGIGLVIPYWYLTFFYFSFWLQFPLVGWKMERESQRG